MQGPSVFGNIVVQNVVFPTGYLSNGDGTYTDQPGFFLYEGTPAFNNMIASDAGAAGHDIFGNAFLPGRTSYKFETINGNFYIAVNENGTTNDGNAIEFRWANSEAGPWVITGELGYGIPGSGPSSPIPVLGINTDSWNNVAFLNGWTGTLLYKLLPLNAVWINGAITTPTPAPTGTSIVYNVPVGPNINYQPLTGKNTPVLDSTAGNTHNAAYSTTFRIANVPAFVAGNTIIVNAIIPLDI